MFIEPELKTESGETPWSFEGESAPLKTLTPLTTLVDGRCFSISSDNGDITGEGAQGLFFQDTRFLKKFVLDISGHTVEFLGKSQESSFQSQFVGRYLGGEREADSPFTVVRSRYISRGLKETIEIRNYSNVDCTHNVTLRVEGGFESLFAVKEGRTSLTEKTADSKVQGESLWITPLDDRNVALKVTSNREAHAIDPESITWEALLPAGGSWKVEVTAAPWLGSHQAGPTELHEPFSPLGKLENWQKNLPTITSDNAQLNSAVATSITDIASLRIYDSDNHDEAVIAAGVPWFMTLFGRDSLITAWMTMVIDPSLAANVLRRLARLQGTKIDAETDEAPGKILHEIRFLNATSDSLDSGHVYYGSADSTPLFLMLLGELDRWGTHPEVVEQLLPNADRAFDWIEQYGIDSNGYVTYKRSSDNGLSNQGWKDSGDGIRFADGTIAEAPIALCEIQAYVYSAYKARAFLDKKFGQGKKYEDLMKKAENLKQSFNNDFWIESKQWFAVGLDGEGRQIDSLTSNIGHCLWAGIVDEDKAAIIAQKLMSPDMFTGWGIRTMSSCTGSYNPTGYHTGSVWPHDSAIVAAGLLRYDFIEEAHKIILGLLEASSFSKGRLPEVMGGFSHAEFAEPMPYPASCSPQAWSAASPFLLLRGLLGLDPATRRGVADLSPVLPKEIGYLEVKGIKIRNQLVNIVVDGKVTNISVGPK